MDGYYWDAIASLDICNLQSDERLDRSRSESIERGPLALTTNYLFTVPSPFALQARQPWNIPRHLGS